MADNPAGNIRQWMQLLEGDVVKFPGKKAAVPDSLKYAAANNQQNPQQPGNLGDVAREIILRNLDKIFNQEPLSDADRDMLHVVLSANDMVHRMMRNRLVNKVLTLYRKGHPGFHASFDLPDQRKAYLKDDPTLTKYRLIMGAGEHEEVKLFDHRDDLDLYVLTNLLGDTGAWSEEERNDLKAALDRYAYEEQHPKERDARRRVDNVLPKFDPEARPRSPFDNEEEKHELIPSIEKFLQQYDYGRTKGWWLWVERRDPVSLEFHNKRGKPRKLAFTTLQELEQWVIQHKADILQWAQNQQNDVMADDVVATKEVVEEVLKLYREILSGNADPEQIKAKVIALSSDEVDYLGNPKVKHFIEQCIWNFTRPTLWQFITEYYLTWFPEQVERIMRGE